MKEERTVTVTQEIVTNAVRRHWQLLLGRGSIPSWVISAALLATSVSYLHSATLTAIAVFALVALPLMWVLSYLILLRRALARFDQMEDKRITFRFTDEHVATESVLGKAEVPWRWLEKAASYPEITLLFFGKGALVYLPTAAIGEPLLSSAARTNPR